MQLEIISLLMLLKRNIVPIVDLNRVVMYSMHSLSHHGALCDGLFTYLCMCVCIGRQEMFVFECTISVWMGKRRTEMGFLDLGLLAEPLNNEVHLNS